MNTPAVVLAVACTYALASTVTVDASRNRRPISPDIYGVVFADDAQLGRMGVTVRRHGGTQWSRYNWKTSTTNTGGDGFYFRTLFAPLGKAASSADDFVTRTQAAGVDVMVELPTLGFVSELPQANQDFGCSFRLSKYGPQMLVDAHAEDCGNGVARDGGLIVNDPLDASKWINDQWSEDWVTHLVSTFGAAAHGGVRFYNLSNQPALWHLTHRDVHPSKATYAELKAKLLAHGQAVKDADPTALTLGPGAWGWLEYFDSAAGDRAATGVDFIPYYLSQARRHELDTGQRILDYLDIQVFPQSFGVADGDSSPAAHRLRLRSTRILWDPTYTVESWERCCHDSVQTIIPRMKEWIADYYPGTRLSISAYGWGAIDTPNGALAQADLLGIFGRERVDLALLENVPAPGGLGEDAFRIYRNYDALGKAFGNTSVRTTTDAPGLLDAFGAIDDTGHATVVLLNKSASVTDTVALKFQGMGPQGAWRAFEFGRNRRLSPAGAGSLTGGTLSRRVGPETATLIEFTPTDGVYLAGDDGPQGRGTAGPALAGSLDTPVTKGCGCGAGPSSGWALAAAVLALTRRRAS